MALPFGVINNANDETLCFKLSHVVVARPNPLSMLQDKHGNELNQFRRQILGHGTICLTDIEAGYLYRVESVAAGNARMVQAAAAARRQGLPTARIGPRI